MSSIIGKQFENKGNGEVVKVVDVDGNIAVLENDQRISVERLYDGSQYSVHSDTEVVTENSNALHNNLKNQIMGLSNESVNNASNIDSGIQKSGQFVNPVEDHSDAQRRLKGDTVETHGAEADAMIEKSRQEQLQLEKKMSKQAAKVAKSTNIEGLEEDVVIPINRNLDGVKMEGETETQRADREMSVKMMDENGSEVASTVNSPTVTNQPVQKEVNPMFTKMKRTKSVSLKIDIEEMMPSKDLLKMLEEGFEDSVLDYLTDEIAGKVLTDKTIKSQIKKKLHEYVYGKPRAKKKTAVKKETAKK